MNLARGHPEDVRESIREYAMTNSAVRLEAFHVSQDLLATPSASSHMVQFYEEDKFLSTTVAQFVGAGLAAGEPVIIIATQEHRDAFCRVLKSNAFDVPRACKTGQLTLLDARTTLSQFMVEQMPDGRLFQELANTVLAKSMAARPDARPRLYGEMVDLLWRDANPEAAIRLEELWNRLGEQHTFSLLCAYSMGNFSKECDARGFEHVCSTHTHVVPTESYSQLESADARLREIGLLQQRARSLENEIELRKELEKQLRSSERKLKDFFENGEEGLHWVGPDGNILWANRAEMNLFGYSQDQYIGHHVSEFYVDPAVAADILGRLGRGETVRDYEARMRCKDGSIKCVLINSNVLWEDGKFVHTRCFTRDITARKSAEEQLRRAEREARDANRLKDEFLTTVSHELRTPLNAILGWARLLRSGRVSEDKIPRALETIERNTVAQVHLVEDLLDVSRIIAGKVGIELQQVQLAGVVEEAIDSVRLALQAKQLQLHVAIDPAAGAVAGDPDRLKQVVWNVLGNAIKFTPDGGRIELRLERRDAHVAIQVSDSGKGIPASLLGVIFERFTQADGSKTRTHGGLGLGLAISRHFVELHGGSIEASSEGEGLGATFTVLLPRSASSPPTKGAIAAPPSDRASSPSRPGDELRGLTVLVVENDEDSQQLLCDLLEEYGCVVLPASSAEEGLAILDRASPAVALCDIGMPGTDGYEFIRMVRERPAEKGGRIAAASLTGYAGAEERRRALRAGYQMHLAKPFDAEELVATLANLAQIAMP